MRATAWLVIIFLIGMAGGYVLSLKRPAEIQDEGLKLAKLEIGTVTNIASVEKTGFISWSQLDDPDFFKFTDNLRRSHCPAQTINDIVTARIIYVFRERVCRLRNPMSKHWASDEENVQYDSQVSAIHKERDELFKALNIPDPSVEEPVQDKFRPITKTSLLPEAKLKMIASVRNTYPPKPLSMTATPEEKAAYYQNRRARLEALGKILTPEELFNYRIEQDSGIKSVAYFLKPINVTPDELNRVAFTFDFSDPAMVDGHFIPEVEQALRDGLGEQRYAEYRDAFSRENMAVSQFIMSADISPQQVSQLRAILSQATDKNQQLERIQEVLGLKLATQYYIMTKNSER